MAQRLGFILPLLGLVLLERLLFWSPLEVVVDGALFGGRIALIAVGIALVYRANRVVNFAQGDLGAVPASFAVLLVVAWSWNYWIGLVVGLGAAVVLGVLVETLIVRRFFDSPRLVLTVATIGLAQLLTGAALYLPRLFGIVQVDQTTLEPPFGARFEIGTIPFDAHDILTLVFVPLTLVGLGLFLHRSTVGIAILAAAERPDRASTLGIPVRRLHTVVWVLACLLAFVAMYLRAGVSALPLGQVLPPLFLVQALAAAVFGRFQRFTTIAAAAVGLGILDRAIAYTYDSESYSTPVVFLIVLVGLLLTRRRNGNGRVDADASTWQATREVRPIPRELVRLPEVWWGRAVLWAVLAAFVGSLPVWLSPSDLYLATTIVIFGIVAASLVVLTGWAGQVSLGHMAFVGVGAMVAGTLTDQRGWDLILAALVAGLTGAVVAVVVGYPALRRKGLTLAVSTLAFALVTSRYVVEEHMLQRLILGDGEWEPVGRIDTPTMLGNVAIDTDVRLFYTAVAGLVLAMAMVAGLRRSRTGRVLIAIRENEAAAASYGIHPMRTTTAAFALSGFLAAMAGSLYVFQEPLWSTAPNLYTAERSLEVFSMVVIGGLGSLPGALLGATYVQGAGYFFPGMWQYLATGAGLLVILMLFPAGLGGVLADVRDGLLRRVAKRRGIVVPSLLADVRVEEPSVYGNERLNARSRTRNGGEEGDKPAARVSATRAGSDG